MKFKNFAFGMCISGFLELLAILMGGILVESLPGNYSTEFWQKVNLVATFYIISLLLGIMIGIAITIVEKHNIKNIKLEDRQKVLKHAKIVVMCLTIVFVVTLILSIVKKLKFGIIISIAFICSLILSDIGFLLGNNILKNNVDLINQKLDNKNNNE
jgi:amino acid transporter